MSAPPISPVEEIAWTMAIGDNFCFTIEKVRPRSFGQMSNADLNGSFPTKLAAIECLIVDYEDTRAKLNSEIARAKRMRARLLRATLNPEGTDHG